MKRILPAALLLAFVAAAFAEEDLTVLTETPDGIAPGKQLEVYLKHQFYKYLDDRRVAFEALKSGADCRKWQEERREFFVRQLGGFPQRTSLNARIVIVLAAELRGIGETETGHDKRDYGYGKFGRDVQEIFLAYLIGRSYVGMRAEDVASWSSMLAAYKTTDDRSNELHLIAIGEAAIPALHAAALDPECFVSVRLRNMISSWTEVVRTPDNQNQAANVVHGALKHYDLQDLIDLAGKEKVRVEDPVDVLGNPVAAK